jgi:hypothetical protein
VILSLPPLDIFISLDDEMEEDVEESAEGDVEVEVEVGPMTVRLKPKNIFPGSQLRR